MALVWVVWSTKEALPRLVWSLPLCSLSWKTYLSPLMKEEVAFPPVLSHCVGCCLSTSDTVRRYPSPPRHQMNHFQTSNPGTAMVLIGSTDIQCFKALLCQVSFTKRLLSLWIRNFYRICLPEISSLINAPRTSKNEAGKLGKLCLQWATEHNHFLWSG
jgi:hypothetical protein